MKLIDTSSKAALASSLSERFAAIGKNYDEVLERLGAAQGDRDELRAGLVDLKSVMADMNRTRVPVDGKAPRRLPVTKEAVLEFGLKALHAADSKNRVKRSDAPWGTRYEIDEDDDLETFKRAADDLRLLGVMLGIRETSRLRNLKYFQRELVPRAGALVSLVKEAFDIQTPGEGLEWLSTDMSEQFIEMIRMERTVAALFEEVPMRHGKLTFPTWLVDLEAFQFAESTADSGAATILDGLGTKNVTSKFELEAKAAGTAATISKFLEEDSAVDFLPWARSAMVTALKEGEEDWIVNGDLTGTHMDADIAAVSGHMAKMGYGLRYAGNHASNAARESASGAKLDNDAAIRDLVLKVMGNMDAYGVKPENLALIVGSNGNAQMLSVPAFQTAYAIGAGLSTNVKGRIGFTPYGWAYAVTSKIRKNLASTGVNTSGATTPDKTATLLANTRTWKLGRVREVTLQLLVETRAKNDQNELLATMRQAFGTPFGVDGTRPHVGYIYDQGI